MSIMMSIITWWHDNANDENVYADKIDETMLILQVKMVGDDYAKYDIVNYNSSDD